MVEKGGTDDAVYKVYWKESDMSTDEPKLSVLKWRMKNVREFLRVNGAGNDRNRKLSLGESEAEASDDNGNGMMIMTQSSFDGSASGAGLVPDLDTINEGSEPSTPEKRGKKGKKRKANENRDGDSDSDCEDMDMDQFFLNRVMEFSPSPAKKSNSQFEYESAITTNDYAIGGRQFRAGSSLGEVSECERIRVRQA